jgi:anti-anti-sigma regulatory factor
LVQAFQAKDDVRIDLSGLGYTDTSLMLDLAMLSNRLRRRGYALLLCGASPQTQALIEIVGVDRLPGVRTEERSTDPLDPAAA